MSKMVGQKKHRRARLGNVFMIKDESNNTNREARRKKEREKRKENNA